MRLFLFDIDGTLLDAHRAGYYSLVAAMQAVFGTAGDPAGYDWRGKTDPLIVRDVLRASGVSNETIRQKLPSCFETYVRLLDARLSNGHPVTVLPGIPELVHRLGQTPDALVGILTGNVEGGATVKLKPTGLAPCFRVAAYGSDESDRRRLPAIARQRAQGLLGLEIPFREIVIIGDTPLDVDCARASGCVAVAVATGQHSVAELDATHPDLRFSSFVDVDESLRRLTAPLHEHLRHQTRRDQS
jgi:phosphoglycolate phosphatase-like HAD superfamily hydrolase